MARTTLSGNERNHSGWEFASKPDRSRSPVHSRPPPSSLYCHGGVGLRFTTPLTANRAIWFALRWSLGGGVASTRSEGDCELRTDVSRTAQATPLSRERRHPQRADWAGRKRQPNTATPLSAVGDERGTMASKKNEVAGGGRSSKELDKKPIWLGWFTGRSGR